MATARKPDQLSELVSKYGDRVLPVALDVTDSGAARAAVAAGVKQFGRIDILVNNAGYGDLAAFEDMSEDMFRAQIDTNFYGVVNVTRAVLPVLRAQRSGHIFQVSSIGGRSASVGLTAYQAAKWAVGGFSRGVAQEVAPFGIRVTVLQLGGMTTDWAGSSMTIPQVSEPYKQTVGPFAEMLRSLSGKEVTSPTRVAAIVSELTGREHVPIELLLGTDAVHIAREHARALGESDEKWRAISESASDDRKLDFEAMHNLSLGRHQAKR